MVSDDPESFADLDGHFLSHELDNVLGTSCTVQSGCFSASIDEVSSQTYFVVTTNGVYEVVLTPQQQLELQVAAQQSKQNQKPGDGGSHPGVEVLTFDPAGHGKCSFGHQAISINGTTYSFGESGKWVELPTDVYLGKNNFRNGVGQVLNLTKEEAASVVASIKADEGVKQKWGLKNNCTSKVRDMLEQGTHKQFWLGSRGETFAPADFKRMLNFLGYVTQTNDYPKSK